MFPVMGFVRIETNYFPKEPEWVRNITFLDSELANPRAQVAVGLKYKRKVIYSVLLQY